MTPIELLQKELTEYKNDLKKLQIQNDLRYSYDSDMTEDEYQYTKSKIEHNINSYVDAINKLLFQQIYNQ